MPHPSFGHVARLSRAKRPGPRSTSSARPRRISTCAIGASPAGGDSFTDQDVRNGKRVCLVGQTIVHELFQDASPLGRTLQLHGAAFRVIGVLSSKGANGMGI